MKDCLNHNIEIGDMCFYAPYGNNYGISKLVNILTACSPELNIYPIKYCFQEHSKIKRVKLEFVVNIERYLTTDPDITEIEPVESFGRNSKNRTDVTGLKIKLGDEIIFPFMMENRIKMLTKGVISSFGKLGGIIVTTTKPYYTTVYLPKICLILNKTLETRILIHKLAK